LQCASKKQQNAGATMYKKPDNKGDSTHLSAMRLSTPAFSALLTILFTMRDQKSTIIGSATI
jgi:hypothetical protein